MKQFVNRAMKVSVLALSALFFAACGGFAGDSGEIALAESVKDALADKDLGSIFADMTPEAQNEALVDHLRNVRNLEDDEAKQRDERLASINKEFKKWNKDWADLDLEGFKAFAPEDQLSEMVRYIYTDKKFDEKSSSFKITNYSRGFQNATDWGAANVTFENEYGCKISVSMVQRAGTWMLDKMPDIEGFEPVDPDAKKDEDKDDA